MTKLLTKAFKEAAKLPKAEQDTFANWLLAELTSERRWEKAFAESEEALARLADEALAEFHAGRTVELDPDSL